ncbi:MAG: transcriptional repressor LexA [Eubacteriales bacterium]
MQALTRREKEIYDYICKTIEENGYSPSVRDIRDSLGIKSTSTVHAYIGRLEEKGYVRKEDGKSRTITLGDDSASKSKTRVPILGQVAAGLPILAEQNIEGYIDFSPNEKRMTGELFALRVKGESMIDAGIMNGDYVIVCRTSYVENGDIAVAMINDEATVKTFYRESGYFRLQPENKTMKPIITKELYILGKVIASVRYYD